ncbi:MAG: hypothetical protein AAF533_30400 [Acidobacteriota bacterium]
MRAEPLLELSRGESGVVMAHWSPAVGADDPTSWNLYGGDLMRLGEGGHEGSPVGRCGLAGATRELVLEGHADQPGHAYYLLTRFEHDGVETGLGTDSSGGERAHLHPCRHLSACPSGGPLIARGVDWSALHGSEPPETLPVPDFTVTAMDGTPRSMVDLVGHATVLWFYPAAATGG